MDVDEFMAFYETRPDGEHWELIEGHAIQMSPASLAQRRIAHNLCDRLHSAFTAQRLDLFAYINVCVRSPGVQNFQPQPDVVVIPGIAGYDLYSECFQLIAEIFSPSNSRKEIDSKLRRYCEAPDNLYAVVIKPREFLVEIYARSCNWQVVTLVQAHDPIDMPEFGLRCRVADLFWGTPLNPRRGRFV